MSNTKGFKRASNDHAWDALNDVYRDCASFSLTPMALTPFLQNRDIIAKVKDTDKLERLTRILAKDTQEYGERLKALHTQHQDRSGHSTDTNDMLRSIQLGEQYIEWGTSFESVILPTMDEIRALLAETGVTDIEIEIPKRQRPGQSPIATNE